MKYTAIRKAPDAAASAEPRAVNQEEAETKESPTSKVWKKYKTLGYDKKTLETGAAAPEKKLEIKTKTFSQPTISETKEETKSKATGFAAIIEKYQRKKEERREIQSLKVKRPDLPNAPRVNLE